MTFPQDDLWLPWHSFDYWFPEPALLPLFSGLNVALKREVKLNSINPVVSTGRLQSWNGIEMKQCALLSAGT